MHVKIIPLPPLALLTAGTASGSWRTPKATEGMGRYSQVNGKRYPGLWDQVKMWPTPHGFSQDGRSNGPSGNELGRAVNRSLWPTPDANMGSGGRTSKQPPTGKRPNGTKQQITLNDAVKWATPTSRDWKSGSMGTQGNSRPLSEQVGGSLNPTWVEWLMGYPLGWTALEPSATPSSRKSRKR